MSKPVLWIVIPCYNEEQVLPITAPMFLEKIHSLTAQGLVSDKSRVLFVNDGSRDKTWELIQGFAAQDEHYIGISQSRNRGHQNAVLAGLMEALHSESCDITISIDCDGQDDINAMDEMVKKYLDGAEVVYGVCSRRDTDTFFKRFTAEGFYHVMNALGADIVFNRAEAVNNDAARQELHKLVRQASRKWDIAYEFKDGSVAYDDIPDPLPFDINADPIDIPDDDFGIWYMDCQDEPQKYTGKTVRFLAQVCQTNRAGKNSFVPGRFAMTCCVQDIQFVGFPCSYDGYKALEQRAWVKVTAKVGYKFHNIYRGKGPVLTALSVEPAEKPLNDVVTFS